MNFYFSPSVSSPELDLNNTGGHKKSCCFFLVGSQINLSLVAWYPKCLKPEQVYFLISSYTWARVLFKFFILLLTNSCTCQLFRDSKIRIELFLQLQLFKLHLTPSNTLNPSSSEEGKVPAASLDRFSILQLSIYFIIFNNHYQRPFSVLCHFNLLLFNLLYCPFPFSDESELKESELSFASMVWCLHICLQNPIQFYFFYLKKLNVSIIIPLLSIISKSLLLLQSTTLYNSQFMPHLSVLNSKTFFLGNFPGYSLMFFNGCLITCVINTVKFPT